MSVTTKEIYNDVNNKQDATTFSFINLFKSSQHISGDKFAHPQEQFLTVYRAFGTLHRHCCSKNRALYQKLYMLSKSVPEDGRICRLKYVGLILTFRHRASCILGQAFHYSPENAFYIFNQQIYFII